MRQKWGRGWFVKFPDNCFFSTVPTRIWLRAGYVFFIQTCLGFGASLHNHSLSENLSSPCSGHYLVVNTKMSKLSVNRNTLKNKCMVPAMGEEKERAANERGRENWEQSRKTSWGRGCLTGVLRIRLEAEVRRDGVRVGQDDDHSSPSRWQGPGVDWCQYDRTEVMRNSPQYDHWPFCGVCLWESNGRIQNEDPVSSLATDLSYWAKARKYETDEWNF